MKLFNKTKKLAPPLMLVMLILPIIMLPLMANPAVGAETYYVSITSDTDKQDYYLREPLNISGIFLQDGQPVTDGLIALEVRDPADQIYAYRTVSIGNPQEPYNITIVEANLTEIDGDPLVAAKVNTVVRMNVRVRNNLLNEVTIVIASTLYDNNLIPIDSSVFQISIDPQHTTTVMKWVYIPEWAKPGKALICTSIFSDVPSAGGMPYTKERIDYFDIVINDQIPPPYSQPPTTDYTESGYYEVYMKTSPDRFAPPGLYNIYARGMVNVTLLASATADFNVLDYPSPPQASFTYYPPKLYENMSATFDASSSSAEGYNDTIIRYEWTFNDPYNPQTIIKEGNFTNPPSPTATHTFPHYGTFIVDLNVTDNEGLWSTTSKPVTIFPEFGPTANFTWTPATVYANKTIANFNASLSTTGWSAQTQEFSPIVQYTWNFGDGTGNFTSSSPLMNHTFREVGNFTVYLTVTDAVGRTHTTSKTVQVLFYAFKWDVTGDGYVGIDDIFAVALHFGLSEGDPGWDPIYDINDDGYIGIDDIFEVAMHFGEEAP